MKHVMTREERSASNIKAVRLRARMSQEQFAETLGVATNTISRIETGATSASSDVVLKICEKFFASADYLFGLTPYEEGGVSCDKTCEELLNARSLIETQEAIIRDLRGRQNTIRDVLNGKINIKLEKPDCPI